MYESVSEDIRGTIHGPSEEDFRPEAASKSLRSALSGIRKSKYAHNQLNLYLKAHYLESDDKTIIQILISHTNFQRQKIITAYQSKKIRMAI
jgi:glutamate formiminotransferase